MKALALILALLVLGFQARQLIADQQWENPPDRIGTRDLSAFWAGVQVFEAGGNPYKSQEVLLFQKTIDPAATTAQVFLNPPWTLPLLEPFMWPSFPITRALWLCLNISLLIASGFLIRSLHPSCQLTNRSTVFACVFFLPGLMNIWMGQLTIVVLFSLCAATFFLVRDKPIVAGLLLVPVTIKSHLVLVVLLGLALIVLKQRSFKFIISAISGFLALNLFAYQRAPQIFGQWRAMDFSPLVYQTSTLSSAVRHFLLQVTGEAPTWPVYAVPFLALLTFLALCCFWPKYRATLTPKSALIDLSLWSLIVAPYAWFYDYTLALPAYLSALCIAVAPGQSELVKNKVWGACALSQLSVMAASFFTNNLEHYMFFPFLVLISLGFARHLSYRSIGAAALGATLFLSGCTGTILPEHQTSTELQRLVAANRRPIELSVTSKNDSIDAGHQFLLIAIPFGSVRISNPSDRVKLSAMTELAKAGYRPIENALDQAPSSHGPSCASATGCYDMPSLLIDVDDISLSAYDFIFFRRLSCTVKVKATVVTKSGQPFSSAFEATENSTNKFGFSQELDDVFDKALTKVSQEIVRTFNL